MCLFLISACGDKLYNPGPVPEEGRDLLDENGNPVFDINEDTDTIDIVGNYNITQFTFDSDPSEAEGDTVNATVTPVMRQIYVSDFGEGKFVQAAIKMAYLSLNEDGTYTLYYKFMNASNQVAQVGKFSEGQQEGKYEILGTIISFYPSNSDQPGLAHADDSTYTVGIELNNLILTANTPSLSGDYFYQIKGPKK